MHERLPGLTAKIAAALSTRSEYLVTQPAELRILHEIPEDELKHFAESHGWSIVRRLGGRQVEFYNDARVRAS